MNKEDSAVSIVTVCDNHFVILLAALIKSIELNHKSEERIDFYIVEDNLTIDNKTKLIKSIGSGKVSFKWLKMKDVVPKDIKLPLDDSSFPLNVYVRLFIPYFIPQNLEKVIYLDVDMIVLEDISKLWNIDMEDRIIAGVVDRSEVISCTWCGINNYKELSFNPESKYFNSGLLVIKPIEWRKQNIAQKVIDCINKYQQYAYFPDQYGLNVIFIDQWKELDKRWNNSSLEVEKHPFIIHFAGRKPIYKSYDFNMEYQKIFYEYLHLTEWKNYKPVSEIIRLLKKLYNKVEKKMIRMTRLIFRSDMMFSK
jgi:lipopolysaccharide biosynthesis glycosyltransferase